MGDNTSPHILGKESIGKLLIEYSVPAIIGMTVTSLYHVIDSIFIGQGAGAMGITGLAVTLPLMNLIIAFCTLVAIGGATISSIYMGQRDIERTTHVLHNVFLLLLIIGIFMSGILLLVLDPVLIFFGASATTLPYARDFMQVILIGTPISFIFIGLNNIMRATGYPKKAMLSALLSVGINIILAPIFIFTFKWGMRGAALATVISQFFAMIWVLAHFCHKGSFIRFRKGQYVLQRRIVKSIFAIGLAPFLLNVCACIVVVFINMSLSSYGGDMAIGAYGIINRMLLLIVMIVMGLNQGMQPILGYNYGAKEFVRVRKTLRYGIFG
ncbi:MAG: MATE family efflux transporter, partial [Bacteroidales bacterium]